METKTETPAAAFAGDVAHDLEILDYREALKAIDDLMAKRDARLDSSLIQAWRDSVEGNGLAHALAVIAREVKGLADESGHFDSQEKHFLAAALSGLAEDAERI